MATSRIARFITEVAPPQYVSVMRSKASKMLDTINEEDREVGNDVAAASSPKSPSSLSPSSLSASATATSITSTVAVAAAGAGARCSGYLFKEVQTSFSVLKG